MHSAGTIVPVGIEPEAIVGDTRAGVSKSWHEFEGNRSAEPAHVWRCTDGLGNLRVHTLNGFVITTDDRADERVTFRVAEERLALLGGFPLVDASSPRSLCRGPRQVKRRTC